MVSKDLPRHGVGVAGGEEGVVAGREGGPQWPQWAGARLGRAPHPRGPFHLAPRTLRPLTLLKVRVRVEVWGAEVKCF